ncbi:growth arrest and DNA damage-inducible proteins-interacting protein 1-like [Sarcoptes scabiei]|nr:growth arrest and DNA damage-inducible proteins-interacting protein 1-like [Sarcoptes scabiei]
MIALVWANSSDTIDPMAINRIDWMHTQHTYTKARVEHLKFQVIRSQQILLNHFCCISDRNDG